MPCHCSGRRPQSPLIPADTEEAGAQHGLCRGMFWGKKAWLRPHACAWRRAVHRATCRYQLCPGQLDSGSHGTFHVKCCDCNKRKQSNLKKMKRRGRSISSWSGAQRRLLWAPLGTGHSESSAGRGGEEAWAAVAPVGASTEGKRGTINMVRGHCGKRAGKAPSRGPHPGS